MKAEHIRPSLFGVIIIGAFFAAVVSALLLIDAARMESLNPLDHRDLTSLKLALADSPQNETLVAAIRDIDLDIRDRVFTHQAMGDLAAKLLLVDAVVVMIALGLLRRFRPPKPVEPDLEAATATWAPTPALAGLAVCAAVACLALIVSRRDPAPATTVVAQTQTDDTPPPAVVAITEAAPSPWPAFRGPGGRAVITDAQCPQTIGDGNRRWRCPLPKPGYASPVLCGDIAAVLCGDAEGVLLLGIDIDDGSLRWQVDIPARPGDDFPEPQDAGWVASTPVCDDTVIAATCANGTVVAVKGSDGTLLWMKQPGAPRLNYGYGSSLMIHGGSVYLQRDCDDSAELIAYDLHSGEELWSVLRDGKASWASPVMTDGEPPLVVCAGEPEAVAYTFDTGAEAWRAEVVHGELGPSPAAAFGSVLTCQEGSDIVCLDATSGEVRWRRDDFDLPDVCSPLLTSKHVYIAQSWGLLQCLDRGSGEKRWEDYDVGGIQATPLLVGDTVYLLNDKGELILIEDKGEALTEVARSSLGEKCVATPMIVGKRIYIRSDQALHCFEAKQ